MMLLAWMMKECYSKFKGYWRARKHDEQTCLQRHRIIRRLLIWPYRSI